MTNDTKPQPPTLDLALVSATEDASRALTRITARHSPGGPYFPRLAPREVLLADATELRRVAEAATALARELVRHAS